MITTAAISAGTTSRHDPVLAVRAGGCDPYATEHPARYRRSTVVVPSGVMPMYAGAELERSLRARMELLVGHDLADVRVHTGEADVADAERVDAAAFTHGADIHFGRGRYRPGTTDGDRLLLHELTHVVQQRGGTRPEGAAEAQADAVTEGRQQATVEPGPAQPRVQRQRIRAVRVPDEDVQEVIDDRDPATLARRLADCQAGRRAAKTFPFRATRFGAAPLSAHRDGEDIVVKQPVHVHTNADFRAQTRTLPLETFTTGLRLPRYEVVKVHVYEPPWYKPNITGSTDGDRESEFCIPAEGLLRVSDASTRATLINIAVTGVEALSGPALSRAAGVVGSAAARTGRAAVLGTSLALREVAPPLVGAASRTATTIGAPAVAGEVARVGGGQVAGQVARAEVATVAAGAARAEVAAVATQTGRTIAQPAGSAVAGATGAAAAGQVTRTPIAGAEELRVSPAEYERILGAGFAQHGFDPVLTLVDQVGHRAAQAAARNPRFVAAVQNNNLTLAGTLFHSEAAREVRALPAAALPAGWRLEAEAVVQAGAGGSRIDVLARGPGGLLLEFDWKTTAGSALSYGSRQEMRRHAGQITARLGGSLARQESRSWFDYVRGLVTLPR